MRAENEKPKCGNAEWVSESVCMREWERERERERGGCGGIIMWHNPGGSDFHFLWAVQRALFCLNFVQEGGEAGDPLRAPRRRDKSGERGRTIFKRAQWDFLGGRGGGGGGGRGGGGGGGGGRGRHGGGATASMLAVGCSSSVVMSRLRGSGLRADWWAAGRRRNRAVGCRTLIFFPPRSPSFWICFSFASSHKALWV